MCKRNGLYMQRPAFVRNIMISLFASLVCYTCLVSCVSTLTLTLSPSYIPVCTGAGVPHIVEQILQSLDERSLGVSEQVSITWRNAIEYSHTWSRLIKYNMDSNSLWRHLFKRRGW